MDTIVNKGFILIEIIISVMLLSVAGITLLKLNSNQKKLYTIARDKLEFSKEISIVVNQHSINLHKKNINLYDIVKKKYNLKNNNLIKMLKDTNIDYLQKYSSIINQKLEKEDQKITFLIDTIKIFNKKNSSKYITVKR